MKTKTFNKILVLNKKSIANLDIHDMNEAQGGRPPIIIIDTYTNCVATCLCTVETVCHVTTCS
jgi:hypothetical protein